MFEDLVYSRHIERIQVHQVHPVPDKITNPRGPFPLELFDEPEIVVAPSEDAQYGATAQNDFKPKKFLRCSLCFLRVAEDQTESHECGN